MKRLVKTILIAVIGFAVGYGLTACTGAGASSISMVGGLFGAGFPFGWSFLAKLFGEITIYGGIIGIILMFFKFCICVCVGWVVLLVELALSIYEAVQYLNGSSASTY